MDISISHSGTNLPIEKNTKNYRTGWPHMLTTSPDLDWAQKSNKGRGSMRVMEGWWWVTLCVCMYVHVQLSVSVSVREDRREEEKEKEGADTALKTKTPHVNVGNHSASQIRYTHFSSSCWSFCPTTITYLAVVLEPSCEEISWMTSFRVLHPQWAPRRRPRPQRIWRTWLDSDAKKGARAREFRCQTKGKILELL